MSSFSQRKGLKPIKKIMQKDGIDDALRNSLWNTLKIFYWNGGGHYTYENININKLAIAIWLDYFKQNLDEIP